MSKSKIFIKKRPVFFVITAIIIVIGFFLKMPANVQASTKIVINESVFPEKALREEAFSFDNNKDGMLSKSEIKEVKSLSIFKFLDVDDVPEDIEMPIYEKSDFTFDFQGIEYFTSLQKLNINLSGGCAREDGKHYDSVIFHFDKVYKLKKLTSFSLSSAKQKNIDLSKLPKLKSVNLYVPNLSTLTIHNNRLKKIWLGDSTSKMESLDFQNAPNLTTLYLNNMESANVIFGEKNTALQTLSITGNGKTKVKSLAITYLKNLKKLSLIKVNISNIDFSKNINLEEIYVGSCSVKTLDFSKNEKLKDINCKGKKITEIIIPKNNVINGFGWVNANLDTFENEYLNPDTLKIISLVQNHIQSLDLTRYPNLSHVFVDENVNVQLAHGLNPDEIIYT